MASVPVAPVVEAMNPGTRRDAASSGEPEAEQPGVGTVPPSEAGDEGRTPVDEPMGEEDGDESMGWQNLPVPEGGDDAQDALVLRNKSTKRGQKGKELDPRGFDQEEWEIFREADSKQWQAHLESEAVRVVSPEEAKRIDPSRILPIPARFVRTNKAKGGDGINAKSRLVVPGHLAPKEDVRTDAPVAPQVALYTLLSLAVTQDWQVGTFDVADAFLSGKENTRTLYVRPPREGIKGVPKDAIIELVKGVFGLKESPRLWWLKLRDAVLDAGFQEVKSAPGTFRVLDKAQKLVGMLVVHVDDGVWAGAGPTFAEVQKRLRRLINIKIE